MIEPILTIVIPCYNHGQFLEETLASIQNSTKKYISEVIIVNDGSSDEHTLQILKKIEAKGYFVLHQNNQGLAKARNNGIRIAKGVYILSLDSDNNVLEDYLNSAIDLMIDNEEIDIVYGNAKFIGDKSGVWQNHDLDVNKMLYSNHIDACAIFKKEVWENNNGYSEDMPYMGCEDWNFWLKCIDRKANFYFLNKLCFEYRVVSNSMIRSTPNDFNAQIFSYNTLNLHRLYYEKLSMNHRVLNTVFYGGVFRKMLKIMLNHFKVYKY